MTCLIILLRSRVGHLRVAIRSVVTVWRRWSFLTNLAAVLYFFKTFNLGSGVWIPYRRHIQFMVGLACYRQFLLHQVCMVRGFILSYLKLLMIWKLCQLYDSPRLIQYLILFQDMDGWRLWRMAHHRGNTNVVWVWFCLLLGDAHIWGY